MWERGVAEDEIKHELAKAEAEDSRFIGGKILGSMCTEPLDIAKNAHYQFLEANLGNAGLYPGTQRLEEAVVQAMADMLHCQSATGSIVSGGTEANITSLWIARNKTGRKKVIFPKSAHFSFHKACDILALEPVVIPLTEDFTIDVDEVADVIDDDVCAIVGIAGTTELGVVDDIAGLAELLPDEAFLHVDAAFGGFVLPFLKKMGRAVPDFDFTIPEVTTMTVDPHKMGMSTIPAGALLIRDEKWIDNIHKEAPYLSSVGQTAALSGTRCSAAVAATYAAMRFLGEEGYVDLVKGCMETTHYTLKRAGELGIEPVVKPLMNIVCFYVPDPKRVQRELDELGWKVSVANNPECLRLVIMPHVTKNCIDELFSDLEGVLGGIS